MQSDFDINDASAKFAAQIVSDIYRGTIKQATRSLLVTEPMVQSNLREYARKVSSQFSSVRTIASSTTSLLLDIYQPTVFDIEGAVIDESEFVRDVKNSRRAVVRGHAGAGKSLFLKRQFLRAISERRSIPIFFELRNLNSNFSGLFLKLYEHAHGFMSWLDMELFKRLLSVGKFEVYLDALDEVSHSIRATVNSQVATLINQYPKSTIIMTTRYGGRYSTPASIKEYHVRPFSLNQAVNLINALNFDDDPKGRFVRALQEGLFEKHSDLLSNPLLCSIMLLTYRRFASIPDRLHLYYQQAYEVLFSRHDAAKDNGFKRDIISNLDVAEMNSVLNYIAAVSYASERFEFSETEFSEMISESLLSSGIDARAVDVKNDLEEAVSMIHPDGLYLKFVHRSFQEFFCASYISKATNSLARACIDAVKMREDTDSVIPMSIALNEDRFKEAWMLPTLNQDIERTTHLSSSKRHFDVVREYLPTITIRDDGIEMQPGSSPKSRNMSIYMLAMGLNGSMHSAQPGRNSKRTPTGKSSFVDLIRDLSTNVVLPQAYRQRLNSPSPELDLEDANWIGLADLSIWEQPASIISASMKRWHTEIGESTEEREVSPMAAFERAREAGMRRLEGDLAGGKPRERKNEEQAQ